MLSPWGLLYIGKFPRNKGSREKISRSKIFALWAFHANLTHGENVEEYGRDWCICGCHVYHEIWRQLLKQLHHGGRHTCQFRPEQSDYTAHMAHVSTIKIMRYGWLLPLLDLLQQLPRMVLRMTTNLLDQEDCYGILLLKNFVRVIFAVTDNCKFLTAKISDIYLIMMMCIVGHHYTSNIRT